MNRYYCEAFDQVEAAYVKTERRIGTFIVLADTMCGALTAASKNIEVAIRPTQYSVKVTLLAD